MVMTDKGRMGTTGTFTNTVPPKSAEQAILVKQDEIIDRLNAILAAIAGSTDGDSLQLALNVPALVALIEKVKLV